MRTKEKGKRLQEFLPYPIQLGNFPSSMLASLEVSFSKYSEVVGLWTEGPHEGTLEIWWLMQRTVVLLSRKGQVHTERSTYYRMESILLCHRDLFFLFCLLPHHQTWPRPTTGFCGTTYSVIVGTKFRVQFGSY